MIKLKIIPHLFLFLLLCLPCKDNLKSQDFYFNPDSYHSVYLFSNSADLIDQKDFLNQLDAELASRTDLFTVILAGDAFDLSLSTETQYAQLENLYSLIRLVSKYINGNLIVLTGDRDWAGRTEKGDMALLELDKLVSDFVEKEGIINFQWIVNQGCPGPVKISIDEHIDLLSLNTQWWNIESNKPLASDGLCDNIQLNIIEEELVDYIEENLEKNILVAAHHPVMSIGRYGGRYSFIDHFKPFPLIGLFTKAHAANIGNEKDLSNEYFSEYTDMMEDVIFKHDNVIYISGHEHNHQILREDNNYQINSGLIHGRGFAPKDRVSILNYDKPGIMRIRYFENGGVDAKLLKLEEDNTHQDSINLFSSFCYIKENLPKNFAYIPCKETDIKVNEYLEKYDTEIVSAGKHYKIGPIAKWWLGAHYREEWSKDIKVPILDLENTFGGLNVIKRGGGRQTLSLKFESANGTRYTFRSVDKDPSRSLKHTLDHSLVGKVFRDQTSAQYPFSALIASSLLDHLDILHVKPKLFLMPKSGALNIFQEQYGGLLGMLEELPGKKNHNGEYFANADSILKSNQLFKELYRDPQFEVNAQEYLRARIFDIWIGDWSRHEDNWKWAVYDKGDKKVCRPIPRDRDWAFSKWDGILPSIADLPFGMPNTESFDHKIKGFKSAVFQARYIDRFLLTEMTLEAFLQEAKYIQDNITEENIRNALSQVPSEVHSISSEELQSKLIQRKANLDKYAIKFFEWLNKEVEVVGTNQDDKIIVRKISDHQINVTVKGEGDNVYYNRTFNKEQSELIKLYGLNGDDEFIFKDISSDKIKTIAIGGKGLDNYISENLSTEISIYDREKLSDTIDKKFIFHNHWNEKLYDYNRTARDFNSWFPILSLGYSGFTGATVSVGNNWTFQKWNKKDFASKHKVRATATSMGDYGLEYYGVWRHILHKWDLTMDLSIANPEYYNSFYGIGNNTQIFDELDFQDYYQTSYNQYKYHIGINRGFWNKSYFEFKTGISAFYSGVIENTVLEQEQYNLNGVNETLWTLPLHLGLNLDLLDHSNFPNRGVRFKIDIDNYKQLTNDHRFYGKMNSSIEYYTSNYKRNKLTFGAKLFASRAFGKIPYYLLSSIGGNLGLRGFTSFRFVGDKALFLNLESRLRLLNKPETTIPFEFGVMGFYDIGRVYDDGENLSIKNMKSSYGGGVYLIPLSRSFAFSISLAWSKEEAFYPVISFGSSLN